MSVGGGALASLPVLAATLGLAAGAVRYGWDLDNVTAPLVSTLGDVLTLPALYLATGLLGLGLVTTEPRLDRSPRVAVAALVLGARSDLPQLRRIVRSSIPVLLFAGLVSSLAGVALERRLDTFSALPALLILVPAHLSSSGALGGILSGRLSSQLLLGLAPADRGAVPRARAATSRSSPASACPCSSSTAPAPTSWPALSARSRPASGSWSPPRCSPAWRAMVVVLVIAYYGTIAAVRLGIDPDTYGIPLVSSTVDLVGALTLVVAIATLGLT